MNELVRRNLYLTHMDEDELCHYGILGMKWGVRRFQPYPKGEKKGKEIGEAESMSRNRKKTDKMIPRRVKKESLGAKIKRKTYEDLPVAITKDPNKFGRKNDSVKVINSKGKRKLVVNKTATTGLVINALASVAGAGLAT